RLLSTSAQWWVEQPRRLIERAATAQLRFTTLSSYVRLIISAQFLAQTAWSAKTPGSLFVHSAIRPRRRTLLQRFHRRHFQAAREHREWPRYPIHWPAWRVGLRCQPELPPRERDQAGRHKR